MQPVAHHYLTAYGLSLLLLNSTAVYAAGTNNSIDARIRRVVESLLKEKDQKIQQLEARIEQLANTGSININTVPPQTTPAIIREETLPTTPKPTITPPHTSLVMRLNELGAMIAKLKQATADKGIPTGGFFKTAMDHNALVSQLDAMNKGIVQMRHATVANQPVQPSHSSLFSKLDDLGSDVAELKQKVAAKGLDISGFFDVNAKTDNATEQNFSLGSVELDLEYAYNEHFAVSSALTMCGNSSGADFAAPAAVTCGGGGPGGIGAGGSGIAVAFVDYHWFDSSIPPRGRIFNGQGVHLQAGRFDLPFSSDYQNYANKDRVSITAPITTSRMQFGGYNGDGVRSYGAWNHFNYSAFWTDAMYANDGTSLGGRLGITLGKNTYRVHNADPEGLEVGISYLGDLDKHRNLRHAVYGADLSFGYHFLKLQSEFLWLQARDTFIDAENVDYGKPNEFGYHATLIADLESFIDYRLLAFARYGRWQPSNNFANDFDGRLVAINNVSALSVGFNYALSEHLKFKLEYTDSLGTATQERYFDKRIGSAQMVVAF